MCCEGDPPTCLQGQPGQQHALLCACRDDLFSSVLPVHREIQELEKPLKILVFSGDVDGVVPGLSPHGQHSKFCFSSRHKYQQPASADLLWSGWFSKRLP